MIFTQWGHPCEIVAVLAGTLVQVRLLPEGTLAPRHLADLRADGGQGEIDAALARCASSDASV